jgi:hypothetical protein
MRTKRIRKHEPTTDWRGFARVKKRKKKEWNHRFTQMGKADLAHLPQFKKLSVDTSMA